MGKPNSKQVQNSGDPQVNILNKLDIHDSLHESHEIKLLLILLVVCVQLVITIYQLFKRHSRAQTLKLAKSIANLQTV